MTHRNSGFSHEKWPFSTAMLVITRGYPHPSAILACSSACAAASSFQPSRDPNHLEMDQTKIWMRIIHSPEVRSATIQGRISLKFLPSSSMVRENGRLGRDQNYPLTSRRSRSMKPLDSPADGENRNFLKHSHAMARLGFNLQQKMCDSS